MTIERPPAATEGAPEPHLRRVLGFWQVTAGGVGIIIGAGIYVLIGAAAKDAGTGVWMAFLLAAGLCALTGLSYAELASMYPSAGAEYEYARKVFPRRLAFVVGWVMIAGLAVAAGTISLGFARYLSHFADFGPRGPAIGLIVVVTAIAIGGIRQSATVVVVLSAIQVAGLLVVIAIGLPHVGDEPLIEGASAGGVLSGAALVFFAFIGFDEVITLSEETREPSRTIPRALGAALGISAALYVLVAIAALSVLGADDLGSSERPLADVVEHGFGGSGAGFVAVVAMLTTTNTTLLAITAASRLTYAMGTAGALPARLGTVSRGREVPVLAILGCAAGAMAFAAWGELETIAGVTDFAVYLEFVAVNLTVVLLRFRAPLAARPVRSPWSIGRWPVLAVAGLGSAVLMLTQIEPVAILLGLGVCLLGLGASFFDTSASEE